MSFLPYVLAEVDTDIATLASTTVDTFKENMIGILSSNISNIVIVGVAVLGVLILWRFARRFVGGR